MEHTQPCPHEDQLIYGKVVYHDTGTKVIQVQCHECKSFGTVVEAWNDDEQDYQEQSESWHEPADYHTA